MLTDGASECTYIELALSNKPIAGSMHSKEVLWLFGVRFEFLAQSHQVSVYGTGRWVMLITPYVFEELMTAQRLSGMTDKVLQQLKFFRRYIECLA